MVALRGAMEEKLAEEALSDRETHDGMLRESKIDGKQKKEKENDRKYFKLNHNFLD